MSKLIVVIGITGTQGGSVAKVFTQEPGWKVRGLSRDVNSAKAKAWTAQGVEMVQGNLEDVASLKAAFQGAQAIYSTTDFWQFLFNPAHLSALKPGQTINEFAFEREVQQGKNLADAAATVPGLERYVLSALSDAKKWSGGKYTWVYHFDGKAEIANYVREKLPSLAAKMSILQVGAYMSNWKQGLTPTKQGDGTYRITNVGSGDKPIPQCDTATDTGSFVRALVQVSPGKELLGFGDMISWKQWLKTWCQVNDKPYGGYDEVSLGQYIKGYPELMGRELGEMMAYMDEFGYDGGDPAVVYPKDIGVPCPTTSWAEYCKKEDFSSLF